MERVILVGTHAIMTFGLAYGEPGAIVSEDDTDKNYPITLKLDRYGHTIRVKRSEIKSENS